MKTLPPVMPAPRAPRHLEPVQPAVVVAMVAGAVALYGAYVVGVCKIVAAIVFGG